MNEKVQLSQHSVTQFIRYEGAINVSLSTYMAPTLLLDASQAD